MKNPTVIVVSINVRVMRVVIFVTTVIAHVAPATSVIVVGVRDVQIMVLNVIYVQIALSHVRTARKLYVIDGQLVVAIKDYAESVYE